VILLAVGLASAGDSPDKKLEKTRKMAAVTLEAIQKSVGYAVFNDVGTNLLAVSAARAWPLTRKPSRIR